MRRIILGLLVLFLVPMFSAAETRGYFNVSVTVTNACNGTYSDSEGYCWYAANETNQSCTTACGNRGLTCFGGRQDEDCGFCLTINPSFTCLDKGGSAEAYVPGYDAYRCEWSSSAGNSCDSNGHDAYTRLCVCGTTTTTTTLPPTTSTTLPGHDVCNKYCRDNGYYVGNCRQTCDGVFGPVIANCDRCCCEYKHGGGQEEEIPYAEPGNKTVEQLPLLTNADKLLLWLHGDAGIAQTWVFVVAFASWWWIAGKRRKRED